MTTARIEKHLASTPLNGARLVMDMNVVKQAYLNLTQALPKSQVFYAIKANPEAPILKLLADLGSSFDCASVVEIQQALAAGATPERISYGSTMKKQRDIATSYALGVRIFSFDCDAELEKIARAAPQSRVICRILCDCEGSDWPLSRKFGCEAPDAVPLLTRAKELGLIPYGVAFHVGSQQKNPKAWDSALASSASIIKALKDKGITLPLVNLGGGFPSRAGIDMPTFKAYGEAIEASLKKHFGDDIPQTWIEPGRGLVADAGVIESEVILISRKSHDTDIRWVYLDIGKFGGLAETMDEAIRYPIRTPHDGDTVGPCILAGPTCDSADVLYEKTPYPLPLSLSIGDRVVIEAAGAYTSMYASIGFNGIPPLDVQILPLSEAKTNGQKAA